MAGRGSGEVRAASTFRRGTGVHAEIATTRTDATQAGKVAVTVDESATVKAEKDGVYVAGKRVFASDHARVYEALPSVLLDLNRQTSANPRLSARWDGNGGWARVWFGDGEREADRSTADFLAAPVRSGAAPLADGGD